MLKGFCSPISESIQVQRQIDSTYTFFLWNLIHWIKGFLHLKNLKFASYVVRWERRNCSLLFSSPILGCLVAKKIQLSYYFPNYFPWIFLRKKKKVDSLFIHLSISNYLGLGKNLISSCVDSKRDRDRVWCGL